MAVCDDDDVGGCCSCWRRIGITIVSFRRSYLAAVADVLARYPPSSVIRWEECMIMVVARCPRLVVRQHTTVSNPPFGPFSIGRTPPNHISIAMVNAVSMLGAPRNTSNIKGLLLWKSAKKENRQSSGFSSFIPPTRTHFIIAPRIGHWHVDPRKTMVGKAGSTKKRRAPAELNYCHNFKFCVTYI
jgi:hypothetical protein